MGLADLVLARSDEDLEDAALARELAELRRARQAALARPGAGSAGSAGGSASQARWPEAPLPPLAPPEAGLLLFSSWWRRAKNAPPHKRLGSTCRFESELGQDYLHGPWPPNSLRFAFRISTIFWGAAPFRGAGRLAAPSEAVAGGRAAGTGGGGGHGGSGVGGDGEAAAAAGGGQCPTDVPRL